MELIPINDSKLKIMLDEIDMKELNICNESDCADGETRQAIRKILERAKKQIGFNTEGSEIFVQLYTSRSGGCELFVTKGLSTGTTENDTEKKTKRRDSISKRGADSDSCLSAQYGITSHKGKKNGYNIMSFSFDSLNDLCSACRVLQKKEFTNESSAYACEDGRYYLVLADTGVSSYMLLDSLSFLHEYGKRESNEHISTYLCEYGLPICQRNAITTLSSF